VYSHLIINGFGRIGRGVFRVLHERGMLAQYDRVQVNEPAPLRTIGHLLKYDTTYGRFNGSIEVVDEQLLVDDQLIRISHDRCVGALDIPGAVLMECSGQVDLADLRSLQSVAKVIISNPSTPDVDKTIIYGLNHHEIQSQDRIISCGSCTSNALIPVLNTLDKAFTVASASSLTLHSAMNDQPVNDAYHDVDLCLTRSALNSMIPVETALHQGVYRVLPGLKEKLDSFSVRIPTTTVSAIDLSVNVEQSVDEELFYATLAQLKCELPDVFNITKEPLVSSDYRQDSHSGVIDLGQSRLVAPTFLKVFIWFDNEWGYSNRMVDTLNYLHSISSRLEKTSCCQST